MTAPPGAMAIPPPAPRPVIAPAPLARQLEALATDEPHGVERPSIGVSAKAVDRDDPRVLQAPGDLRLQQEAGAAASVVGVAILDLFQRHLSL